MMRAGLAVVVILAAFPSAAAAAPDTRVTFYFGLKRPEAAARAAFFAASTSRQFATVREISHRYGASDRTKARFRHAVHRRRFSVRIDRSGVFARVTGTVRLFEDVFGRRIQEEFDNDVQADGYFARHRLRLPRDIRPLVRDVVPSYARSRAVAQTAQKGPGNEGTWRGGCKKAKATGGYSFAQVRHAYGIDSVGAGAGASVAIMNVGEGMTAGDRRTYAQCFGLRRIRARTLLTDGQAQPFGRGTFEPQEDLALVRGMAPRLRSVMFTQTWETPEMWFLGPAQVLAAPRLPASLSISYGECEKNVRGPDAGAPSRAGARLMDAVLVRLGLAGVSTFAAAGDFGSTCDGQPFAGVTWPGSSPFLTSVGGTRLVLDKQNRRVREVVWNDLPWTPADSGGGAGGGGYAAYSPRPPYQHGGSRRAVPDVSAHASMFPAWPVNLGKFWVPDGGTSASTPLLASAFAVLSARLGTRLGPVNGTLYALADRAVYDVRSGNNGYDRRVPARRAGRGYDLASGLGVPRMRELAAALR